MQMSDDEEIVLNFGLPVPTLCTFGRNNNTCEICWETILCCTSDGIATECNQCGVLMCCLCEHDHMKKHRRDDRRKEKKKRRR
mmetsp:Transcript_6002/g.10069  ORF Transcript_6002/g.10069 Transcript_6002/m.10069 type:complete len:83 (+) Transcript_6002:579-827(+)